MIKVDRQVYDSIWTLIFVALVAGWAVFAFLGSDIYLVVMVAASIVLPGVAYALLGNRPSKKKVAKEPSPDSEA